MVEPSETNPTDGIDEDDSEPPEETESAAPDGPRAADFETVTAELADVFDVDGRHGETITDLDTTETDDGRQVVAIVEQSRSTMMHHRLDDAKRTGRRAGGGAATLAALAGVAYAVFKLRRAFGGDADATDETPAEEISIDE